MKIIKIKININIKMLLYIIIPLDNLGLISFLIDQSGFFKNLLQYKIAIPGSEIASYYYMNICDQG